MAMYGISEMYLNNNNLPSLDDWEEDALAAYSGSDRKEGLISPTGERYLVKYSDEHARMNNLDTSYVNNVLSEYIASHVLNIIGFDAHETFLATRNQELLVACKNFVGESEQLVEFGHYMRRIYYSKDIGRVPEYNQLENVISTTRILAPHKDDFLKTYWMRFVGDALVGNFDRHMGNWGYIVNTRGQVRAAPIYDNASTLFPALSEHGMQQVMDDNKEVMKRVLLFPKAALTINQNKLSYYDMLSSGYDETITSAVIRIVPLIFNAMPRINDFIDSQTFLSDTRRTFYKKIITARYEYLLKPAYDRCIREDFDLNALERIEGNKPYTEKMFEDDYTVKTQPRKSSGIKL